MLILYSYVVSVGVLDKLASYFNNVRGPIDNDPLAGEFLQHSMGLLIALSRIMSKRYLCYQTYEPLNETHYIRYRITWRGKVHVGYSFFTLYSRCNLVFCRNHNIFEEKKCEDPTQLITTFRMTELVGIVSLMYGMLLHSDAPARGDTAPPELPPHAISVAAVGFKMLNHMATLDLKVLQVCIQCVSWGMPTYTNYYYWVVMWWPWLLVSSESKQFM